MFTEDEKAFLYALLDESEKAYMTLPTDQLQETTLNMDAYLQVTSKYFGECSEALLQLSERDNSEEDLTTNMLWSIVHDFFLENAQLLEHNMQMLTRMQEELASRPDR